MILFLNYTPIEFMGGAEKWMFFTAKKISLKEKTILVSLSPSLANIYGKLVLKRKFDFRVEKINHPYVNINFLALIPLTSDWKSIRKHFKDSRVIYAKFEINEIILVLYFCGLAGLKKTIVGIHSPFIYKSPLGIWDNLHNFVYKSQISRLFLRQAKKIHVLNKTDEMFMKKQFKLSKVILIPNTVKSIPEKDIRKNENPTMLNILFVGELSIRKGIDVVLEIIKSNNRNLNFTIVGDGEFKEKLKKEIVGMKNVIYLGHIKNMSSIYKKNDVLFIPSRAESMSLAALEALSHGLLIVNSVNTSLSIRGDIEYSISEPTPEKYLSCFMSIVEIKKDKPINSTFIKKYFEEHYSESIIEKQVTNLILS